VTGLINAIQICQVQVMEVIGLSVAAGKNVEIPALISALSQLTVNGNNLPLVAEGELWYRLVFEADEHTVPLPSYELDWWTGEDPGVPARWVDACEHHLRVWRNQVRL
jgi:hypothetical protein